MGAGKYGLLCRSKESDRRLDGALVCWRLREYGVAATRQEKARAEDAARASFTLIVPREGSGAIALNVF
jgi:hypothetical protein